MPSGCRWPWPHVVPCAEPCGWLALQGMWRMLQQDKPDDYVLATGVTHTIRSLVEKTFATQVCLNGHCPVYRLAVPSVAALYSFLN